MYIHIYTHFPAYQTAQKADRRSGRNTSTHTLPCLPDRTKSRSPVREKHKHTHTSLPTRPHKRQIAGQGETQVHTHFPAYQTAQMADRRSGRNTSTHTLPCLPDRIKGRSPVRKKNTYMSYCCRHAHTCTLGLDVLLKLISVLQKQWQWQGSNNPDYLHFGR